MKITKINFEEKFAQLPGGDYAVGIVAKMNNYEFKIVKFKSEFIWHKHEDTDETFIILDSTMTINFRDRTVEVQNIRIFCRGKTSAVPARRVEYHNVLKRGAGSSFRPSLLFSGGGKSEMTIKKIE